jgi:hypothetical protein
MRKFRTTTKNHTVIFRLGCLKIFFLFPASWIRAQAPLAPLVQFFFSFKLGHLIKNLSLRHCNNI